MFAQAAADFTLDQRRIPGSRFPGVFIAVIIGVRRPWSRNREHMQSYLLEAPAAAERLAV